MTDRADRIGSGVAAAGREPGQEPASRPPEQGGPPVAVGRMIVMLAAAGLNAWALVSALPALHLRAEADLSPVAAALALSAPAALGAGLWLLWRRSPRARLPLVLVFPLWSLLPALAQPSMVGETVLSPAAVAFAAAGLAGYLLLACWAQHRVETVPLRFRTAPRGPGARSRARWLGPALAATAAAVAAVVIGAAHLLPSTPLEGAGSRGVVTSTLALVLWGAVLLALLAPAARSSRLGRLPLASRGAAAVWIAVLALALAMLVVSER